MFQFLRIFRSSFANHFKKIPILFLFVLLNFSLIFTLTFLNSFPTLAQNPKNSKKANSINSAKATNFTNNIQIKVTENSDNLELEYNILQTFGKASRGIFLSFPKNMDGVWTNFQIKNVQKADLTSYLNKNNNSKNDLENLETQNKTEKGEQAQKEVEQIEEMEMQNDNEKTKNEPDLKNLEEIKKDNLVNLTNEKYEKTKEWNEFRVRIGEVDKILPKGSYLYQIKIKTTKNSQNQYNFQLIGDWNDQIDNLEIIKNNKVYCNSQINSSKCNPNIQQITINPDKSEVSGLVKFWLSVWLYLIILVIISVFGYSGWFVWARDPDYGFLTDKPEFEPPNLLPWESQFLVNDGKIDFQNTFLSYLLYLSNYKFIKIIGQNEQNYQNNSQNNLKSNSQNLQNLENQSSENSNLENSNLKQNSSSFFGKIVDRIGGKKEEKVQIQILKTLPNLLPHKFNEAISLMETDGFEQGIYNSQINSSLQSEIESNIYTKLKHFYLQGYNNWQIVSFLVILGIGNILWFFGIFDFVQKTFLVGNSYRFVIPFASLIAVLWLIFILIKFSKLTRIGAETKAFCQRYNYYIIKVEQFKLDFSNNPKEGVQYYLKILPYAAIIGSLPQFQKYLVNLFPNVEEVSEISNSFLVVNALNSTTFYTPPSSSSSGGSDTSWSGGGFDGGGGSW